MITEQKAYFNGVKISYKFKPRKYDTRHLIVIFSGFGASSEFTYDFQNALSTINASVLWIKDDFDGHCGYYMLQHGEPQPELATLELIMQTIHTLGISKNECTLAGFSKGGSAALYFGTKYNFRNLISTVPQIKIGSYVTSDWPITASHMIGRAPDQRATAELDSIIPNTLKNDVDLDKNIYLITSKSDIQYPTQIEPFLGQFIKYKNFNLITSESILVRAHNQVTSHHAQLILGIMYTLTNNIAPRIGYHVLKGDELVELPRPSIATALVEVKNIWLAGERLFIEGIAVLKGIPCGEWSDIDYELVFESQDEKISLPIAKDHRPNITRELYGDNFVNYDKGWFCTYKHKGVSLETIPPGNYSLAIHIVTKNLSTTKALNFHKAQRASTDSGAFELFANTTEINFRVS
jgi:hypothetical protein